jgi:hypothetical protein
MSVALRIQLLFHWESQAARALATRLYSAFSVRPLGDGPRIPLRYGPRRADGGPPAVDLSAEREIVVVLVDERMTRRARDKDRPVADAWGALVASLLRDHPPTGASPHRLLPVALDAAALGLSPALDQTSFVRLDAPRTDAARDRHLVLHIAIRALRALQDLPQAGAQPIDQLPDIPLSMFISHAKADLSRNPAEIAEGPVKSILATLAQLPIEGWYDSRRIPPGGRFPDEIARGVLTSSAMIAVLTDNYSSREWCRREILDAKLAARPLVVVDAIETRVIRLFPYLGNAVTMRWRAALAAAADDGAAWTQRKGQWEAEDAALVIEAALLEALRYQHDHKRLQRFVKPGEVALGAPPEALTLSHLPAGVTRVWYPDPPLGSEELTRLRPRAPATLDMTTPLGELARAHRPANPHAIAVSLSNAPDCDAYGGSPEHLANLADGIVLYLLVAGMRVAYGGVLGHGALSDGAVAGDEINYVERLLAMVRSHSALLQDVAGKPPIPLENWVAWPLHLKFSDADLRVYGQEATLKELPPPPDLGVDAAELQPDDKGFVPPGSPPQKYARARALTYMRKQMCEGTSARIAMGGKLADFSGPWPGVLEEGLVTLRAGQPLYLLGVFGGAARLLIDALRGVARQELTSAYFAELKGMTELRGEYARRSQILQTPEQLVEELRAKGAAGLAAALDNGLSEAENAALVVSDDPQEIVALILKGLRQRFG